ncbi:MAG: hypothetical protein ABIM89_09850 [Mycobacteriales bacterium]
MTLFGVLALVVGIASVLGLVWSVATGKQPAWWLMMLPPWLLAWWWISVGFFRPAAELEEPRPRETPPG